VYKSTKTNDKSDARQLIVRAVNAEKEAAAARKQARLAKIRYKQARKAFKQAKKAAKQARKEAKIAANTFQAKAEKAKKPQKNRTKSKKHIKVATRKAPATARRLRDFIYGAGNLRDPAEAYIAFRGRLPAVDALLKKRGLDRAAAEPVNS